MEFGPVVQVGSKRHVPSLSTLRKFLDSMLARMFNGDWGLQQKDGAYFIDRSGELFEIVLEYLRDGSAELPEELADLNRVLKDA
jgi:hypothetical protein